MVEIKIDSERNVELKMTATEAVDVLKGLFGQTVTQEKTYVERVAELPDKEEVEVIEKPVKKAWATKYNTQKEANDARRKSAMKRIRLAKKLMAEKGIKYFDALREAAEILAGGKKTVKKSNPDNRSVSSAWRNKRVHELLETGKVSNKSEGHVLAAKEWKEMKKNSNNKIKAAEEPQVNIPSPTPEISDRAERIKERAKELMEKMSMTEQQATDIAEKITSD